MNRLIELWQNIERDAAASERRLPPTMTRWLLFGLGLFFAGTLGGLPLWYLRRESGLVTPYKRREFAADAARRYRAAAYRDTAIQLVRSHVWTAPEPLWTYIDPALSKEAQDWASSTIRTEREVLGTPAPGARVAVLFLLDTITPPAALSAGGATAIEVLPSATGGTCVAVVRMDKSALLRLQLRRAPGARKANSVEEMGYGRFLLEGYRRRTLRTCAYFYAFGTPGVHVAEWFDAAEWHPVHAAAWDRTVPTPVENMMQEMKMSPQQVQLLSMMDQAFTGRAFSSRVWYRSSIACLAGVTARCPEALANEPTLPASPVATGPMGVVGLPAAVFDWEGASGVPALGGALLGTWGHWTVQRCGREAFAKFWRSPEPVATAYAAACGEPFDAGIQRWMQEMLGPQDRGPSAPLLVLVSVSLATLLALGIALKQRPPQV